jgi:hypothetical protein
MADHLVGNTAFGDKPVGAHEFDFAEAVFANQSQVLGDSTKAGGIELLTNLAASVGINATAFAAGPLPPTCSHPQSCMQTYVHHSVCVLPPQSTIGRVLVG